MSTKEEIRKAAEQLNERIDGIRTEKVDDPSLEQLVQKALNYFLHREDEKLEKSETVVAEETTRTEEVAAAAKAGEEGFYEEVVAKSEGDLQEMMDAAPALESLTDAIGAVVGRYEGLQKSQALTEERLQNVEMAVVPMLRGMEAVIEIMKSVRDQPVSKTSPGFVFTPGTGRDDNTTITGEVPENLREKVLKAVTEGKLDSRFYSMFDTRGAEGVWAAIPPEMRPELS